MHALNNVFQARIFTQAVMDEICNNLAPGSWMNPHKSLLGLGNYDINVIMTAVQKETDYEVVWFDKRKDPRTIAMQGLIGFLLNIPSTYMGGFTVPLLNRRHWIAVRQISGDFYNLDSKMKKPEKIGTYDDVMRYIQSRISNKDDELFLIVPKNKENVIT